MKTRSLFETHRILCAIIMAVIALTFTTCEGPMGPQGETGESSTPYVGENGNWWINGVDTGIVVDGVISVTRPTKTGYYQYESFNSAGMVVRIYYTDGTVAIIENGYNLYWNDALLIDGNYAISAEPGTKTVTVQWRNKTAAFTITVADPSGAFTVKDTESWEDALSLISVGGNDKSYVIEVTDDVGVAGTTSNSFGSVTNVQVTLIGDGKLYLTSQGSIISIGWNQTLIIESEDLTLEGFASNNTAVVYLASSTSRLELRNGTISGNSSSSNGGGVYVTSSASFTMSGGTISGNTSSSSGGGGVYSYYGTFTMSGGSISGNTSSSVGGGVYVNGGTFTMSGGSINGNKTTNNSSGGGVYVGTGAFNMSGGNISGNTASYSGGGVSVSSGASFTKASETTGGNSGVISGNTATNVANGQQVYWGSSPVRYINDPLGETDELSTSDPDSGWLSQ